MGRPKKEIPSQHITTIKQQYEKTWCGAVYLEKKLINTHNLHISHNMIHRVLLKLGYAKHETSSKNVENLGYVMSGRILYLWHILIIIIPKMDGIFVLF